MATLSYRFVRLAAGMGTARQHSRESGRGSSESPSKTTQVTAFAARNALTHSETVAGRRSAPSREPRRRSLREGPFGRARTRGVYAGLPLACPSSHSVQYVPTPLKHRRLRAEIRDLRQTLAGSRLEQRRDPLRAVLLPCRTSRWFLDQGGMIRNRLRRRAAQLAVLHLRSPASSFGLLPV